MSSAWHIIQYVYGLCISFCSWNGEIQFYEIKQATTTTKNYKIGKMAGTRLIVIKNLQYANNAMQTEWERETEREQEWKRGEYKINPRCRDHARDVCVYLLGRHRNKASLNINSIVHTVGFGCQAHTNTHTHILYEHLVYNATKIKKKNKRNMTSDMNVSEAAQYGKVLCSLFFCISAGDMEWIMICYLWNA